MRVLNCSVIVCILLLQLHEGSPLFIGKILKKLASATGDALNSIPQALPSTEGFVDSSSFMGDAVGSVALGATGVLKSIPKAIPTPKEFFEFGKNAILGYPHTVIFNLFHQYCSTALKENSLSVKPMFTPRIDSISFILRTRTANVSIPITNPDALWHHSEFRSDLPLVIFVTGWKTNLQSEASEAQDMVAAAYLCRGNVNFVTIDTAAYVDTLYAWSAFNTELIGDYISRALQRLVTTYAPQNIHLIGHSLGAHICGAAGRRFSETTHRFVQRITGLDPANPCFNSGSGLTGLSRGDAQWVDVIHTNPGVLGKREAIGDCDFYPNGMDLPLQPGTYDIVAAHARAYEYYAESVYPGSEHSFLARKCTSMKDLDSNYCNGNLFPMGYAAPFNLKGSYFLNTNTKAPYGEYSRNFYRPICAN